MTAARVARPWQRIDVRVAAWAGLVAAVLLVSGAFWFRASVHAHQMDATRWLAQTQAMEILGLTQNDVQVTGSFGPLPFELLNSDGTVIAASGDLADLQAQGWTAPLPDPSADPLIDVLTEVAVPPLHSSTGWEGGDVGTVASTIRSDQILVRGQTSFLASHGGAYRVYVFATPLMADGAVAAMDPFLWWGVALACLLVAATAAVTVRLALRPVETMRREADHITTAGDGARLTAPTRHDELGALAATLDTMLGRLHGSFRAQQRFTADAAHELRGPLASLRAAVEVALAHPGDIAADETLRHVLAETDRLQDLTEQLLTVARAQSPSEPARTTTLPRPPATVTVDATAALERVLTTYPADDAARVRVTDHRPASLPAAMAPDDLHRVLRNLLDNALRHAATGVRVELSEAPGAVELTVSNDGPPIPAEDRERIFEPFVRLDAARSRDDGGTGLGLTIVRSLVERAAGSVTVASDDERTSFVVRLPAPAVEAPAPVLEATAVTQPATT